MAHIVDPVMQSPVQRRQFTVSFDQKKGVIHGILSTRMEIIRCIFIFDIRVKCSRIRILHIRIPEPDTVAHKCVNIGDRSFYSDTDPQFYKSDDIFFHLFGLECSFCRVGYSWSIIHIIRDQFRYLLLFFRCQLIRIIQHCSGKLLDRNT